MDTDQATPEAVCSTAMLGPLPEPDMLRGIDDDYYSAEAMNAERQRCYALGLTAGSSRGILGF